MTRTVQPVPGCRRKRMLGVSAVLGMVIGLGITAAVGGGVYYNYQELADLFSTSSQIELRNLNALRDGDSLKITANIKNIGTTSIRDLQVQEIRAGGMVIGNGDGSNSDYSITADSVASKSNSTAEYTVQQDRLSLDGGSTQAFSFVITHGSAYGDPSTPGNISREIQIADRLSLQVRFSSGGDEFISDLYNTRVRPG